MEAYEVDESVRIGHELLAINAAIAEGKVAWSNAHISDTKSEHSFYDTPLFNQLSERRDLFRKRLLQLGGS